MSRTFACTIALAALLLACSSESDNESKPDASTPTACEQSGGHCLGHNAPSAKGQGPADCAQFGTALYGGPLKPSSLSCAGKEVAPGGSIECCVP